MRRLLRVPALSPGWQGSFRDLLQPPAPAAPAWEGFRPLRITRLVHETDLVTSIYLGPATGEARPGQYLTVRLTGVADPPPIRNYSLSTTTTEGGYRLSVKREPHGTVSSYLTTALAVGDQLDVAAPRGEFVLRDGDEPVVLLSAGIGVTPVLAMLHALAAQHSRREVWWLHTTKGPATHALADEARRLLPELPAGHSHIFYTADTNRRLDRAALAQLDLPRDAQVYLCGPLAFMDAMTTALTDLGLPLDHIHTERFSSLTAINPGVLATARPAPHAPATPGTGPPVTFSRAGLTVPFDQTLASLLEMAEACDVPTRWSCRTGVCHTCVTPLLSGAVTYSPPPLAEPDADQVLLCCARPQGAVVLDL
jgi:ferredoxin-NADP reductase/ferredoxin